MLYIYVIFWAVLEKLGAFILLCACYYSLFALGEQGSQAFPVPPVASSTPLHPPTTSVTEATGVLRSLVLNDLTTVSAATTVSKTDALPQRNSSSSELTNITTTDISSHGDEDEEEGGGGGSLSPTRGRGLGMESVRDSGYSPGFDSMKAEGPVALSDVIVSVPSPDVPPTTTGMSLVMNGHTDSEDDPPPPLPSSLPPLSSFPPGDNGEPGEDDMSSPSLPSSPPPPLPTSPMPDDEGKLRCHINFTT